MKIICHTLTGDFKGEWGFASNKEVFKNFCQEHKDDWHLFIYAYVNRTGSPYASYVEASEDAAKYFDVVHRFTRAANVNYPSRDVATEGNDLVLCKLKKEFCQ